MSSINKPDWFKQAIKSDAIKSLVWVVSCFCVTELPAVQDTEISLTNPPAPFTLFKHTDDKSYCYWDEAEAEFVIINNSDVTKPLFHPRNPIILEVGDFPNVKETTKTLVGNVIINYYLAVYPFGDAIPFITGKDPSRVITGKILSLPRDKGDGVGIKPEQLTRYKLSASALVACGIIASPTATKASLTISPAVLEMRDQLLAKHKNELDNPTVIADIEKQLVDYDMELRKDDPSTDFYMGNKKLLGVGRKKQYIMYGVEGGLDGKLTLIQKSLSEGMNFEDMPLTADASTAASQSRGLLTARGGEMVNLIIRLFQTISIVKDDCGTTRALVLDIDEGNYKTIIGRYQVGRGGVVEVTEDVAKYLIGKKAHIRSPGYCAVPDGNLCACCTDVHIRTRPHGISTIASSGSSRIMNIDMKAMHGSVKENIDTDMHAAMS